MRHIPLALCKPPPPIGIYPYFDKLQFWIRQPLDDRELVVLRRICGRGKVRHFSRPARFGDGYRQRIVVFQPPAGALRWLAERNDAKINQLEIAVDYVFETASHSDAAFELLDRQIVRPWHRKNQAVKLVSGSNQKFCKDRPANSVSHLPTRYDARRIAPNKTVVYRNKYSRLTGEFNCLHLEWRLVGAKAARRMGLECGQDLLNFDHRAFWKKRLMLYSVDPERLGRLISNRKTGKKRRTPEFRDYGRSKVNVDAKIGTVCIRSYRVVQDLIDDLRGKCRIERALLPIPIGEYVPD